MKMPTSSLYLVAGILYLAAFLPVASQQTVPAITPFLQREDHEMRSRRDAWIEGMHRTAPGHSWRIIERENSEAAVRARRERKGAAVQGSDTVAGVLHGRWQERGSANQAGRIVHADVDIERGIIYAASAGGNIWRGGSGGEGWRSLNDRQRFSGITMLRQLHRGSSRRLVVLHNSPASLHYSDDDGTTWNAAQGLDTITRWGSFRRGVVAGRGDTIYTLVRSGTTRYGART